MADINASIGLDSAEAAKAIDALSRRIDSLIARVGDGVKINVDASTAKAEASVKGAKGRLESALGKGLDVKVDADTKPAVDAIRNSKGRFESAGREAGTAASSGLSDTFKGALGGSLLGGGLAGIVSTGVSALTQMATAAFDEYKALNTNIQNIGTLGVEANGLDLQRFESLINDLSTRVPDQASNIANGVYNAISAGITGTEEEIVAFVETASKVAVAGLSDTNAAVNGLTSVTNAYGTGASGATQASNVFFAAIKAGKTSFNELNAGLANVIPAASAAGIQFDEVGASIAQLTTVGIPTAQATTQLRAAMIELQKPGKTLEGVMARLGLNASNVREQLAKTPDEGGGFINTMQAIEQEGKKAGLSMTQIFSSSEAASAGLALTGEQALKTQAIFKQVQADVNSGVAEKAFQSASQSIDVQLAIVRNKIQSVFNGVFQSLLPVVQQVIGIFTKTLAPAFERIGDTIGPAFERVGKIVKPILAIIGGVIITQIVGAINYATAVVSTMADIFSRAFDAVKRAIQPLIDTFGDLFGSVGDGVDPVKLFSNALTIAGALMQEVAAIVGELAGLVIELVVSGIQFAAAALNKLVNLFRSQNDETKGVTENTKKAVPVLQQIKDVFDNMRGTIAGVTFAFREIKLVIQEFFDALTSLELDRLDDILAGAGDRIKKGYDDGFNSVKKLRAEQEAAAAAEKARKEAEEAAAAASADAEADAAASADNKKTALEKALAAYKKTKTEAKALLDQELARLGVLFDQGKLSQKTFDDQKKILTSQFLSKSLEQAQDTFKAQLDADGFFAASKIKLEAGESFNDIRTEFTSLQSELSKLNLFADIRIPNAGTFDLNDLFPAPPLLDIDLALNDDILAGVADDIERASEIVNRITERNRTVANSISNVFASIPGAVSDAFGKVIEVNRDQGEKQIADLRGQLKAGEIAYSDYAAKVDGINSQLNQSPNRLDLIFEGVNKGIVDSTRKLVDTLSADMDGLAKRTADGANVMGESFETAGILAGASFVSMVADGQNAAKALVLAAFDALQAMIPIFTAQIFAGQVASPRPDNLLTAGATGTTAAVALTAALQVLVAAARAAVSGSFAKGGLVTGGERIVRINEQGPEYVMNAKSTQRYLPLLDAMNTNRPVRADLIRKLNLDKLGITFADQTAKGLVIAQAVGGDGDKHLKQLVTQNASLGARVEALTAEVKALRNEAKSTHKTEVTIPIDERAMERRHAKRQFEYATKW